MFSSKVCKLKLACRQLAISSPSSSQTACLGNVVGTKYGNRFFAAQTIRESSTDEVTSAQTDIIKSCVKELLEQREVTKIVSVTHLQQSFNNFQNLLNEARLSIADCHDSHRDAEEFREEMNQAAEAVENVFAAYADLLDDFRGSEAENTKQFGNVREESAAQLKALRQELAAIQKH